MTVDKLGYKRLETDEEFLDRVRAKYPWFEWYAIDLDTRIWNAFQMQRRIVEVFP